MSVVLPFVINAGLNFVLGLLIAYFLGPEEFGRYAIGAAIMVFVNALFLDWLKLSAVRFYSLTSRESEPNIRATLDVLAAGITIALSGLLVAAVLAGAEFGLPVLLIAASVGAGICAGLFDYHGAIARARFLDAAYARLIIIKNVLALVLMVGGAWYFRDPGLVLIGSMLSVAAALLSVRKVLADAPLDLSQARRKLALQFMRYALPLVWANAFYAAMPFLNRSLMAGEHGFAEAGYFSLASDMGLRLFGTLGATLEIFLLREVVRLDETQGRAAAEAQIARNMVIVLMIVLPVATGLWLVLAPFEQLLVPAAYQGHFARYMAVLIPAFVALALFQAGLNPVFLIAKKTLAATLAALLGLALNLAIIWFGPDRIGPMSYAYAQTAGFVLALFFTAVLALRACSVLPRFRDMGWVLLGNIAMVAALWPLTGKLSPLPSLLLMASLGSIFYIGIMLALDVAGCRTALLNWRKTHKGTPS